MFFLSIIIPVYNTEKYLRECLDSVITQEINDVQVICVNDGSTDNSLSILQEYQKKNNHISVISQENCGLSGARNTGLLNADGKYIIFLDSDDMLKRNAISEIRLQLENSDAEILLYDSDCIYETEKLKETDGKDGYYHRKKSYGGPKSGKLMFAEQIENDDLCDSACLLAINKKWMLSKMLFFKENMIYEDCLFTFKCFMESEKMMHINKPLMIYRVREHSIMTSNPSCKNLRGRLVCYQEVIGNMLDKRLSVRLQNALKKFAEIIVYSLKKIDYCLSAEERWKTLGFTPTEKLLMASMEIGVYRPRVCDEHLMVLGFHEMARNANAIVIYGAGKIGKIVYICLKKMGFEKKILAFVVSSVRGEKDIDGIPIIGINEYSQSKEVLLLIAANVVFQEDMLRMAYENQFYNIEAINSDLELALSKCSARL